MAFDGAQWNESIPDNNDLANQIDDYMRDIKLGIRGRVGLEHVWPSSQTGTSEAGYHKFITFQGQTSAPSQIYGTATQVAAMWASSGSKNVFISDSAGTNFMILQSGVGIPFFGGTGTAGALVSITSGGSAVQIAAPSTTNTILAANGTTAAPSYKAVSSIIVVSSGQAGHGATIGLPSGVNSNEVQSVMVSIASLVVTNGSATLGGWSQRCEADVNRVVTCTGIGYDINGNANFTKTGTANFVIIGIVTH
jgi:hypothetical protein